jgi:hypothetical protein
MKFFGLLHTHRYLSAAAPDAGGGEGKPTGIAGAAGEGDAEGGDGGEGTGGVTGIAGSAPDNSPHDGSGSGDAGNQEGAGDTGTEGDGDETVTLLGAPEGDYEEFTVPEGVAIDDGMLGMVTEFFRENDMSQVGAQKVVDLYGQVMSQATGLMDEQRNEMVSGWEKEIASDDKFGGGNLEESTRLVGVASAKLLDQETRDMLASTRMELLPGLWRAFARMGKLIADDDLEGGDPKNTDPPAPKSRAERMYGKDGKGVKPE